MLEDARTLSNFARKKGTSSAGGSGANAGIQIDVDDVKLAVQVLNNVVIKKLISIIKITIYFT